MIRPALDSNILVYAELEPESEKGKRAQHLVALCAPRGILAAQALLEFANVVRRRRPESFASALTKTRAWGAVFETAPTTQNIGEAALELVAKNQFQIWGAVIWEASRQAGASVLFTEDLQDGFERGGMRALNPFTLNPAALQAVING